MLTLCRLWDPPGMDRPAGCRHISVWIRRPADEVYRFAADPRNLPLWAAGLAQAELTRTGEVWVAQSPMGQVSVRFTPANDLGVLDHTVTLTNGERVFNPLRVLPAGAERDCAWSEMVFDLRRRPGMSDADYDADAEAVAADLAALKQLMENPGLRNV
ncbi:MAG TPA: SRPBCC family protein [Mycobacterium sp.]|nr:SRPBCC family protein [Mycobacterium sp.]